MKAVDFIVESAECYLFIEIKDPDHPAKPSFSMGSTKTLGSSTMDERLKYKYRDSFLYEWASGRADKPVDYLVLIASERLDRAQLLARRDALLRKLPVGIPAPLKRSIVRACGVFNIASWNNRFPHMRVERASAVPQPEI